MPFCAASRRFEPMARKHFPAKRFLLPLLLTACTGPAAAPDHGLTTTVYGQLQSSVGTANHSDARLGVGKN